MDFNSGSRPAGPVSSAHHAEETTDISVTAPQAALTSSPGVVDTWTSPHLDSQSRDNLRQASVALDTAYERITSLRNSINNMLNRVPPEAAGTGTSTSGNTDINHAQPRHFPDHGASIRPPHSALVLSGEQLEEELNLGAARLRSLISPSARQRLEEFEFNGRSNGRREFVWDRLSQSDRPSVDNSDLHATLPRPRTPPMPDLLIPNARGVQNVNRDDSSTMIGRRVAARVNAADGRSSLSSRLSFSQLEQRLQAQTAQVARELENMTERLAATRSRRVELASNRVRGNGATAAAQDNGPSTPSTAGSDMHSVPNPPAAGRPFRPARDVTLIDNVTRIVLPQPISRTSSDGTPLDELPVSTRRSLSAAFREHIATYRDHTQVSTISQDTPRNLVNVSDVRGTLVNLLTQDRDGQTRQAEHIRLSAETSRRDGLSFRSDPLPPAGGQGRRRRDRTRLNADGDEIDSDSDDTVSPQTRRLRMRFTYGPPSVDQSTTRSHTGTIEDILWQTSGSDSEADVVSPDTTESYQLLFQSPPLRPSLRHPHPLPTPVEDMVTYPAAKPAQRSRMIYVSKYASLAGR